MPRLSLSQLETLHRLHWLEHWSVHKMARHLGCNRRTIQKYLTGSVQPVVRQPRPSKLDPFKSAIAAFLDQDPTASAAVIEQRLKAMGYQGQHSILRAYLSAIRPVHPSSRAFVRLEPPAGDRIEVDWGHFGSLDYQGDSRKLYALCLVEAHSRLMYVEFSHSQSFDTFCRLILHGFQALGGVSRELSFDNLTSAVLEHDGKLVRFNARFLGFARQMGFYPHPCHPAAPWEKGKVERSIRYLKQNFWPLRSFLDLDDLNRQVRHWLADVANCRPHRETRQTPVERFRPDALRPLPASLPDYRDSVLALVHKDLRVHFDANSYLAPPRWVGQQLLLKADSSSITLYDQDREVVRYARCWRRGQTIGTDRFEKQLLIQRQSARLSSGQQRLIQLCGEVAFQYLRGLAEADRPLERQIQLLLELARVYPPEVLTAAFQKALLAGAFGADYIANILAQLQAPRPVEPPVPLKDPRLRDLSTSPLSLAEYDAFILDSKE